MGRTWVALEEAWVLQEGEPPSGCAFDPAPPFRVPALHGFHCCDHLAPYVRFDRPEVMMEVNHPDAALALIWAGNGGRQGP